jgi:hypothetical protein
LAASRRPADYSATRRNSATHFTGRYACNSGFPEFQPPRGFPRRSPEFPPGRLPVLAVSEFLPCRPSWAQGFVAMNFKILFCPHEIHRNPGVIPRKRRLSTALSTYWSTGRVGQGSAGSQPSLAHWGRRAGLVRDGTAGGGRAGGGRAGVGRAGGGRAGGGKIKDEAPPSMSWRGLTPAAQLRLPIARRPATSWPTT